ncbi:MAG: hypothetical protein ACOX8W_13075 [bacterium]|jgi:hypothetical protein
MKRRRWLAAFILICGLALAGCTAGGGTDAEALKAENETLKAEKALLQQQAAKLVRKAGEAPSDLLLRTALGATERLKEKDMAGLADFVHPEKGVRFTPYSFIDPAKDVVLTAEQMQSRLEDSETSLWGNYDGSGEPIRLTFRDYYDRFVYDKDYTGAEIIGNNKVIGTGNAISNIAEVYPEGEFIEFHFSGSDPQYGGTDWRSMTLVFEPKDAIWYLVGIVHSEWTI